MSLTDRKLTEAKMQGKGNVGKPRTPNNTYTQQQEIMDELVRDVTATEYNALIDDLESTSANAGADYIGFNRGTATLTATNVGAAIRETKLALEEAEVAAGNVPIGGDTDQVLAKNSGADRDLKWLTPATRTTYSAEISTTWTGSSSPYTQDVTVTGITADDEPHIMPNYATTNATAIAQKEAWAMVSDGTAGANKITFTCFEDKPTTAIPIQIEVVR